LLRKIEVSDGLQLRADDLKLLVTAKGATPLQFLLNAALEAQLNGFQWSIPTFTSSSGGKQSNSYDLSLAKVTLAAGPDNRTIWASQGQVAGVPVELLMEMPSLRETLGKQPTLPLKLIAAAGDNVAVLEAVVDRSAEKRLLAGVVLSGAVVQGSDRVLAEMPSPLGDYQLSGDISLSKQEWSLPNIQMQLGSSQATGSFSMLSGGPRAQIDIDLHAPYIQTEDLLYWVTDFGEALLIEERQREPDEDLDSDGEAADDGLVGRISDLIAQLGVHDDLDVDIVIDELHAGPDLLGGAEIRLHVDDDEFVLNPVSINLPGGDVSAEYQWKRVDDRLDARLMVEAEALRYGGLLRLADEKSEARGLLYIDTEISALTPWSPDVSPFESLLRNASGDFSVAAWPENATAGMLDLWTSNLVLALLPKLTSGEASLMNCLAARLDVEDGVMETGTALLDSTETIIRGRGTIDLSQSELDLLVAPQAKLESFFSISTPVMVTGPLQDFQIGVEPGGLLGTAMKWWMNLIYVPFKWLTGERFPADGTPTCFKAMGWELTPELHEYFLRRDFTVPPPAI